MVSSVTFDLNHDVALVTGASSGLGAHFAQVLADAGAKVVIAGRRADRLREVAAKIAANGGRSHALALDVTQPQTFTAAIDEAERLAGRLTILVNNAGLNVLSSASALGEHDYDRDVAYTRNLFRLLTRDETYGESNKELFGTWLATWVPRSLDAARALQPIWSQPAEKTGGAYQPKDDEGEKHEALVLTTIRKADGTPAGRSGTETSQMIYDIRK